MNEKFKKIKLKKGEVATVTWGADKDGVTRDVKIKQEIQNEERI